MSLSIHRVLKHTRASLQCLPMMSTFKSPMHTSPPANYRSRDFPLLALYRIACLVVVSHEEKLCIFGSHAGLKSFFFFPKRVFNRDV